MLKNIWHELSHIGVNKISDKGEVFRIVSGNILGILSVVNTFLFSVVFMFFGIPEYSFILILFTIFFTLSIVLCGKGFPRLARIIYLILSNLVVFIFCILLKQEGGVYFFFYTAVSAALTILDLKHKVTTTSLILLPLLLFIILELNNYTLFDYHRRIPLEDLFIVKILIIIFSAIQLLTFLYNFILYNRKNETLLNNTIKILRAKENQLTERNKQFQETTNELITIQELLSYNQKILEESKNRAETALKVKSDFLSSVSHEIRTPMNVIIGLTDLLFDKEKDLDKIENLQLIKNSSNNLLVIINDILDFSKIESGRMIVENVEFNLHDKIKELISSLKIKASDNHNTLTYKLDSNLAPIIKSDPVRLHQIFLNLLDNAIKFTNNGTIHFEIKKIKTISNNESLILFSISDSGIGISPDSLEDIFNSFTQGSNSTTRKYGGTGLGLSISKRIVEMLHGRIWVESSLNKGSTFYVEIPLTVSRPILEKTATIIPSSTIDHDLLRGKKGLIVEDFEMNQLMIRQIFKGLEISCDFVSDGLEVINRSKLQRYDFILMDLNLPEMPGCKTVSEIKKDKDSMNKMTPILAFISDDLEDNQKKIVECEMMGSLSKPINKQELVELLSRILPPSKDPIGIHR